MQPNNSDTIPEQVESTLEQHDFDEETERAYRTLYDAMPGDMVTFAGRTVPMEVDSAYQRDEDTRVLVVQKPQADGTYEVRESWDDDNGRLRITSPVGRATDLSFHERGRGNRKLGEAQVDSLVERLTENAVDAFVRMDYQDWDEAVADTVTDWSERVQTRTWKAYPQHPDWEPGDPEAIFESVVDHLSSNRNESGGGDLTPKEQAEVVLHDAVYAEGIEDAEGTIVQSAGDYERLVHTLAHHTIDRIERKSYSDAHVATRDTLSNWIDNRSPVVYDAILEYGQEPFENEDNEDLYAMYDIDEQKREMALDTLESDVWPEVKGLLRDEGSHDPTVRGMTQMTYDETVDMLAAQTLRRWNPGDGFLRTTAKDVVTEWADEVQNEQWDGHRHDLWADGDVEDIFMSATVHSSSEPIAFNPFSDKKERRMAEQAIISDVVSMAEDMHDRDQDETEFVPADEYLDDVLGVDTDYETLKRAHPDDMVDTIKRVAESTTGDEVGWTFVDEIIESGGNVPEMTNDWVLVDYGVIREGEKTRRLAWFDRSTGGVLTLSGKANAPPMELQNEQKPYKTFHVQHLDYDSEQPDFICQDVDLDRALECVYEYIDAVESDIRIIETRDRDFVQEQITEEDVNATGVMDALVPNLPVGKADIMAVGPKYLRAAGKFTIDDWLPEMARMASYTALAVAPRWLGDRLDGVTVEPLFDSHQGVGTKVSKEFGADTDSPGVGGKVNVYLNIRPKTFSNLASRYTPTTIKRGIAEGDLGKGVVKQGGLFLSNIRESTRIEEYEDDVIPEIQAEKAEDGEVDFDMEKAEELAERANKDIDVSLDDFEDYNDNRYDSPEEAYTDRLNQKLHGIAYNKKNNRWTPVGPESVEKVPVLQGIQDEYLQSLVTLTNVVRKGSRAKNRENDPLLVAIAENTDYRLGQIDRDNLGKVLKDLDGSTKEQIKRDFEDEITGGLKAESDRRLDETSFSWDDFEQEGMGISGLLVRGLDAETLVKGAEFFDFEGYLDRRYTFSGGDYIDDNPPSYEEWKEQNFGVGRPSGPDGEERLRARYHQQIQADNPEDVDPLESLGIDRERAETDYDNVRHDFDDTFGNTFDDVEERLDSERQELDGEQAGESE